MKFTFDHTQSNKALALGVAVEDLEHLLDDIPDLIVNKQGFDTDSEVVEHLVTKYDQSELALMLAFLFAQERYRAEKEQFFNMLKSLSGAHSSQSDKEDGNSPISSLKKLLGALSGGSMKRDPRDSGISLDDILGSKSVPGGRNEGSNSTLDTEDDDEQ